MPSVQSMRRGTSAYTAAVFQAGVDQGIKGLRACVDAADPGQLEG